MGKFPFFFGLLIVVNFIVPLAPAGPAEAAGTIKIAAVGDIMMGTENLLPADGGQNLFTEVKRFLQPNDIVFGNCEAPLTDRGEPAKVWPAGYCFRTPPRYGRHLAEAGFNMISIANNHIHDYGPDGLAQTLEVLEKNNLDWSGPVGTHARGIVRGVGIAMIAFHTSSHGNWMLDIPEAQRLVSDLAGRNQVVIVSFHGGAEGAGALHLKKGMEYFMGEERGQPQTFARSVIDAGADLVIGHGPHVPRAMEIYKGRLIAYSLGNFCTQKGIKVKGAAGLAPLLLAEVNPDGRLVGGRVVSFYQTFGQPPRLDPEKRAAKLINALGNEDLPASNAVDSQGRLIVR
ncbi:MAG: CapA family protein [Pseudomonadota bacterium]